MNDTRPVSAEQLGLVTAADLVAALARDALAVGPRPGWCEHDDRD